MYIVALFCNYAIAESSPVTNLALVASSPESIMVTWDLPEYPNGPLTGYRVYYRRSNVTTDPPPTDRSGYESATIGSETVTQYNISGLIPFTNYSIFVEALGTNIDGLASNEMLQRTNATTQTIPSTTPAPPTPDATSFSFDLPTFTISTGPLK